MTPNQERKQYIITHRDEYGERWQLPGSWEASSGGEAILFMLAESQEQDDGKWEAFEVTEDRDVF